MPKREKRNTVAPTMSIMSNCDIPLFKATYVKDDGVYKLVR